VGSMSHYGFPVSTNFVEFGVVGGTIDRTMPAATGSDIFLHVDEPGDTARTHRIITPVTPKEIRIDFVEAVGP